MSVLGATALAAGISATAAQIRDLFNNYQTKKTNEYNEALMRESWQREDTAVQRRVADLKESGMSPLLAAGDAAQTSQPIQVQSKKGTVNVDALQALSLAQNIKESDANIDFKESEKLHMDALTESILNENRTFDQRFALQQQQMAAQAFKFQMEGKLAKVEGQYKASLLSAQVDQMTSQAELNKINGKYKAAELSWLDANYESQLNARDTNTRKVREEIKNLQQQRSKTAQEIVKIMTETNHISKQTEKLLYDTVYRKLEYNEKMYNLMYSFQNGLRTNDQASKLFGINLSQLGSMTSNIFGNEYGDHYLTW